MPRFVTPHVVPSRPGLKRKVQPNHYKQGGYAKRPIPLSKLHGDHKRKLVKSTRILNNTPKEHMRYTFIGNDNLLPSNVFGFTQWRSFSNKYAEKAGSDVEKMWSNNGPRIAIIGAGISGLSAANHLINSGLDNINIFEASSRLGGRIHTVKTDNESTCELGAEWLESEGINNGLILLANIEGLTKNVDWLYNKRVLCVTSEGRALSDELCATGRRIFNKIKKEAYRLFSMASELNHGTLAYFFDRRIDEELAVFNGCFSEYLRRLMCCFKNDMRIRFGVELKKMSSDNLGSCFNEPSNAIRIQGGLVNALLPLVRMIPQEKIHLQSPIQSIKWCDAKPIVILDGNKAMDVDYVIVTLPLGVLKNHHEQMFYPELPCKKIQAINRLGFGTSTKLFLVYPSNIWGTKRTAFSTVWKARDWSERERYWYKGISTIDLQNNIASVTVGGPEAVDAEEESLDLVAEDITAILRSFLGATILPQPCDVLRSRWNTDRWHYGTGTYFALDTDPDDPLSLSEPLTLKDDEPRVLFAGEATSCTSISTVHGSRITGLREAQRIIRSVKKPSEESKECLGLPQKEQMAQ